MLIASVLLIFAGLGLSWVALDFFEEGQNDLAAFGFMLAAAVGVWGVCYAVERFQGRGSGEGGQGRQW